MWMFICVCGKCSRRSIRLLWSCFEALGCDVLNFRDLQSLLKCDIFFASLSSAVQANASYIWHPCCLTCSLSIVTLGVSMCKAMSATRPWNSRFVRLTSLYGCSFVVPSLEAISLYILCADSLYRFFVQILCADSLCTLFCTDYFVQMIFCTDVSCTGVFLYRLPSLESRSLCRFFCLYRSLLV